MTPTRRPPDERELKREILEDQVHIAELDSMMERRIMTFIKDHVLAPVGDHETRIRDVEKWQWKHTGIFLVAGFLLTATATWWVTEDLKTLRQDIRQLAPVAGRR